jgi:hypothetical protein
MATLLVTSSLIEGATERRVHRETHMRRLAALFVFAAAGLSRAPRLEAQSLRGSEASVDLMYSTAQAAELIFLRNSADVATAARLGALQAIAPSDDIELKAVAYPYVLPNTLRFTDSLAAAYHAGCGEAIVVTSGARPLDEQPRNASPKSVHPTGMAVDFRKPRTPACLRWLRTNLVRLEKEHVIEATEERHPAHFHVAVLKQAPEPRFALSAADAPPAKETVSAKRVRHRIAAQRMRSTP